MTEKEKEFCESTFLATDHLIRLLGLLSIEERKALEDITIAVLGGGDAAALLAATTDRVRRGIGGAANVGIRVATVELISAKYRS